MNMRLSKKSEYAVRALVEIALETQVRCDGLIQITKVAERTNIPEKFLGQILLALRHGGILKSKRGIEGGYTLAKKPDEITLGEIIRLQDGPITLISCAGLFAHEPCSCPDPKICGLHIAMQQIRDALNHLLDNYKLSRLINEIQSRHASKNTEWHFEI